MKNCTCDACGNENAKIVTVDINSYYPHIDKTPPPQQLFNVYCDGIVFKPNDEPHPRLLTKDLCNKCESKLRVGLEEIINNL